MDPPPPPLPVTAAAVLEYGGGTDAPRSGGRIALGVIGLLLAPTSLAVSGAFTAAEAAQAARLYRFIGPQVGLRAFTPVEAAAAVAALPSVPPLTAPQLR